jgi:hypothetical protein
MPTRGNTADQTEINGVIVHKPSAAAPSELLPAG